MSFGIFTSSRIAPNPLSRLEKEAKSVVNNITSELKNDYTKLEQKLDEYAGKLGLNKGKEINFPEELSFPPSAKVITTLAKRMADINENIPVKTGKQSLTISDLPSQLDFPTKIKTNLGERIDKAETSVPYIEASLDFLIGNVAKQLTGDHNEQLKLLSDSLTELSKHKSDPAALKEMFRQLKDGDFITKQAEDIMKTSGIAKSLDNKGQEALLNGVKAVYGTITQFIIKASEMGEVSEKFIDEISVIASKAIKQAADYIEKGLSKSIPLTVDFLANMVGLGSISKKVETVINKIENGVSGNLDKAILFLLDTFNKISIRAANNNFPDIAKTPSPIGPIPIPYLNLT